MDSASMAIVVVFYFIIPSGFSFLRYFRKKGSKPLPKGQIDSLMTWIFVLKRIPWGLIFLMGSGVAMNLGMKKSGLAEDICQVFECMKHWPYEAQILVIIFLTALLTQVFISNSSVGTMMSVLMPLSEKIDVHPFRLCLPSALTSAGAYLLPVSGASLGMVAALGRIKPQRISLVGLFPWALNIFYVYIHAIGWMRVVFPNYIHFPPGLRINMEEYEGYNDTAVDQSSKNTTY